jgi:hypothetical protein
MEHESFIVTADNSPFAARVNENEGLMACTSLCGDDFRIDSSASKFLLMECGSRIVSEFPNIPSSQSPVLARNDSAGDLSTG